MGHNRFPLPSNHFSGGRRLTAQGDDDLVELLNFLAAAPVTKVWPFQSNATTQYAGGFYDFPAADNDFSPSINFGTTGVGVAAHFSVVLGGATVDDLVIRVTGTSITDTGVQTSSDTEDINIPADTQLNAYFETAKKWNGQITVEAVSGTPVTCNYGWSKYHDFRNQDFKVIGLEAIWESDSSDSGSDIELLHHRATGWTFNAGAVPTPPTPLAQRSVDHASENDQRVGAGAWKRTNLDADVEGSDSEGILFRVTSGNLGIGTLSFRSLSLEVEIERVV